MKIPTRIGGQTLHISSMLSSQPKKHLSFHTPGHKERGWDITELSYSDALFSPSGAIRRAQEDIASSRGAAAAFLLTDGSTCGVHAMLYALKERGAKSVAVPVSCHESVHGGAKLAGLTEISFGRKGAIPPQPTAEEAEEALKQADALLLTSPDYYGFLPDLAAIRAVCDRYGKPLLIDGAHGGHLNGEKGYAGNYADMWVDGAHKSLPAYTQGACVFAKSEAWSDLLRESVLLFHTTSPSYPIMASVEYAMHYPKKEKAEREAEALKRRLGALKNDDWTKIVLPFGEYADKVAAELERKGIFAEFNDGNHLMFYLSPCTKKGDLKKLERALKGFPRGEAEETVLIEGKGDTVSVELADSVGMVCAKAVGLFPPCMPLIYEGERISARKVKKLLSARNTFGLTDGKILVYEREE